MGIVDEKFYRFKKKINSFQSITSISKMVKDILTKRNVVVNFKDNIKPHLFPIKGGMVINLKNGEVRDRTREDNFFDESPVTFVEKTPHADKFFGSLMKYDKDKIEVLQTIIGYVMTGETKDKSFFVLHGAKGNNGKSALASVIQGVLRDFFTTGNKGLVIESNRDTMAPNPSLLGLRGKRCVIMSEAKENEKLDKSAWKSLVGNDE